MIRKGQVITLPKNRKIAFLSDIHGNDLALTAVLQDAREQGAGASGSDYPARNLGGTDGNDGIPEISAPFFLHFLTNSRLPSTIKGTENIGRFRRDLCERLLYNESY